jgi:hypothetical protein
MKKSENTIWKKNGKNLFSNAFHQVKLTCNHKVAFVLGTAVNCLLFDSSLITMASLLTLRQLF